MKPIDILIAIIVPVVWGLGLVFAKPAVDQIPPMLLMALRFTVTALALVWFVRIPRASLKALFLAAFVGSTLQYGLTFNGLRLLDASTTALLVQAEVPFLALIPWRRPCWREGLRRMRSWRRRGLWRDQRPAGEGATMPRRSS